MASAGVLPSPIGQPRSWLASSMAANSPFGRRSMRIITSVMMLLHSHQRGYDQATLCRADLGLHRRDHAQDAAVIWSGAACREQCRPAGEALTTVSALDLLDVN